MGSTLSEYVCFFSRKIQILTSLVMKIESAEKWNLLDMIHMAIQQTFLSIFYEFFVKYTQLCSFTQTLTILLKKAFSKLLIIFLQTKGGKARLHLLHTPFEVRVKYGWSKTEVRLKYWWSSMKYDWSSMKYDWSTSEVQWSTVKYREVPLSIVNLYETMSYPLYTNIIFLLMQTIVQN